MFLSALNISPRIIALLLGVLWLASGCDNSTGPEIVNNLPVARAGISRQVDVGEVVFLDGSASADADGETLAYAWIQVSGPMVIPIEAAGSSVARIVFTEVGEYTFRLTVTDSQGLSASSELRLVAVSVSAPPGEDSTGVEEPNRAPVAAAGLDREVDVGSPVFLDGGGSVDVDGDRLSYAWVQIEGPALAAIEGSSSSVAGVVLSEAGEYTFRLTVTDSQGLSSSAVVRLVVIALPTEAVLRIVGTPIEENVVRVEYSITATDMGEVSGELDIAADGTARGEVEGLEIGSARSIELRAYDAADNLVYTGSMLVDVQAEEVMEVNVALRPPPPPLGAIEVEAIFE